jgi:hypothetical protein
MRAAAIGWLSEVAAAFALQQETLFLAAALLDRFMAAAVRGELRICCCFRDLITMQICIYDGALPPLLEPTKTKTITTKPPNNSVCRRPRCSWPPSRRCSWRARARRRAAAARALRR